MARGASNTPGLGHSYSPSCSFSKCKEIYYKQWNNSRKSESNKYQWVCSIWNK